MAKPMTLTWQEALSLTTDCKVIRVPQVPKPDTLVILLEDPAGQKFILQIIGKAIPGLNGNLLTLGSGLEIHALEVQPGDKFQDIQF